MLHYKTANLKVHIIRLQSKWPLHIQSLRDFLYSLTKKIISLLDIPRDLIYTRMKKLNLMQTK